MVCAHHAAVLNYTIANGGGSIMWPIKQLKQIKWRRKPAHILTNYDTVVAYEQLIGRLLKRHAPDRDLAFSLAVGSLTVETFHQQGAGHVAVLKAHGLADGMAIFDLGCGCGRTAQALQRSGWRGTYTGTDIIKPFIDELKAKCPGYTALVHRQPTIPVADESLDMLFHWSVFTHVLPEECYLYMSDSFRAMKPGGRMVFSFMELTEPMHRETFFRRVKGLANGTPDRVLDIFLHRDWICSWAQKIGFSEPEFTHGSDESRHGAFWQTLVAMSKPLI